MDTLAAGRRAGQQHPEDKSSQQVNLSGAGRSGAIGPVESERFQSCGSSCWMDGPLGQARTSMSGKGPYGRDRRGSHPSRGFLGPGPRAYLVLRQPRGAGRGSVGPSRPRAAVTWAAVQPIFLLWGSGRDGGMGPQPQVGFWEPLGWLAPILDAHPQWPQEKPLAKTCRPRWLRRQACHQRHTPMILMFKVKLQVG